MTFRGGSWLIRSYPHSSWDAPPPRGCSAASMGTRRDGTGQGGTGGRSEYLLNVRRRSNSGRRGAQTPWWHLWGPALVAALVGAIPGTVALLNQAAETKVAIVQPQGLIVASGRAESNSTSVL